MAEEIEIQYEEHIEKAKRAEKYQEMVDLNKALIEENTRLTKLTRKDAAKNKKMLETILKKIEGLEGKK